MFSVFLDLLQLRCVHRKPGGTWRIIPASKWSITMVIVNQLTGATFPFQMAFLWCVNGGDPNYLLQ